MSSLLASTQKTYPASLLLNFDGANNSTTFTDSSSYNHTGTAYGNAKISTTQSKFGDSSGYFDGVGDYVEYAANSVFALGTDPFTIECWIYCSALPSNGNIAGLVGTYSTLGSADTTHWWFGLDNRDSTNRLTITRHGDNAITANCIWTPNLNTWYHIAACKDSNNNIYIYINGESQLVNSTNNWASYNVSSNGPLGVGVIATPFYFNGYIDGLRITKGVALYQGSAFPLPNIPPSKNGTSAPKLNNHIVMTSTKSTGDISGYVTTSSGYYTVNWWDGTKTTYVSGANFSRAAIGGNQTITIYPSASNGSLDGFFYNVNIANNSLSLIRAFYSRFVGFPGTPAQGYYYWYNYPYTGWWRQTIASSPGGTYSLDISYNNLSSSDLNQLYTDLLNGNGTIEVSDNTGANDDNPSIATLKGYTVYGSLSGSTELLLNLDGTNGSTTFIDSSSNARSITLHTGSPSLSTTTKKYGTAALNFNSGAVGNDSYIIPDLSNMDWSIEFWIYRPTATAAYEGLVYLANSSGVDNNSGVNIHLYTSNDIHFNNNGTVAVTSTTNVTSGVWHHVACVSINNEKRVYFNGVLMGRAVQATAAGPYQIKIGRSYGYWANSASTAYIDDFKLVRGKSIYTADFVPPTSALTNGTTSATPGITVLLLNGNGSSGSQSFVDSGHKNLSLSVYGTSGEISINTTQKMYGTGSILFSDGRLYLTSPDSNNFNFFNSDFTIECWIRPISVNSGNKSIFSKRSSTSSYAGAYFGVYNGQLQFLANQSSGWEVEITSTASLSTNTWYHVAATRLNNTFKIFINGTEEGSQTVADFVISSNSNNMVIGAGSAAGGQEFIGYIDDLRIIRGVSLYNYNFTPPSSELAIYP